METRIDEVFYKEIGKQLNLKRQMLGYSFKYLSKLTGISAMQLDDYMNGKNRIKKNNYAIICDALGIDTKINVAIDLEI